jgi:predicted transposase/invertase (TIGR01784 family)
MLDVVPLKYGTAFKKAFADPEVFSGFARAVLGIDVDVERVEQEHGFGPAFGRVDIKYDLFAEDARRRIVVELQHVREEDSFDRFLYYHLVGQAEQIQSADDYRFRRTVYTIVVLTRLPSTPSLQFDVAVHDSDLRDLQGTKLGVYGHRLVFVNARGLRPETPSPLRRWLELIDDSLDRQVDETRYPEPLLQRVLRTIEHASVSPQDAYLLKQEVMWENAKREARDEGRRDGEARGEARGEAKGKAGALFAVLAARGLAVDEATRARVEACADPGQLDRWLARALTAASASEAVGVDLPRAADGSARSLR